MPTGEETMEEDEFQDETCKQCIERISYLQKLISLEEEKLFKAMKAQRKITENTEVRLRAIPDCAR